MTRRLLLLAPLLLAGCAKITSLEPAPGQRLPVRPALAANTPTAEDLLQPRADAEPQRVDELLKKSAPRKPDRFDLPPPDGGAPPTSSKETGTATPQ